MCVSASSTLCELLFYNSLPVTSLCINLIVGFVICRPLFAEIVPEKSRTNIYALDRAFEALLASFAPYIVGLLAIHLYGYVPPPPKATPSETLSVDRENAVALSKALYTSVGIPFFLCAVIYSGLYWTYPRDRDRVRDMQLDVEEEANVPLEEITSKEESIWTVGEEDEDEDEDDYIETIEQPRDNGIVNGKEESETARMLPKHDSSL
jgi:hypothetical protein